MYVSQPKNHKQTYRIGENITLACKTGFKEKPGGNAVRMCTTEGWPESPPFECEGKNM